jgi:hypothetical protein
MTSQWTRGGVVEQAMMLLEGGRSFTKICLNTGAVALHVQLPGDDCICLACLKEKKKREEEAVPA